MCNFKNNKVGVKELFFMSEMQMKENSGSRKQVMI